MCSLPGLGYKEWYIKWHISSKYMILRSCSGGYICRIVFMMSFYNDELMLLCNSFLSLCFLADVMSLFNIDIFCFGYFGSPKSEEGIKNKFILYQYVHCTVCDNRQCSGPENTAVQSVLSSCYVHKYV